MVDVEPRSLGDPIGAALIAPKREPARVSATLVHLGDPGEEQMVDGARYVGIGVELTGQAPIFLRRRFDRPPRALWTARVVEG